MNDFDRIAPFYDFLARLVFGKSILQSQIDFLDEIKEGDRVLILGGGTGKLLEYIQAENVIVDYVEPSIKMLIRANKRNCSAQVNFHQVPFEEYNVGRSYDAILCPFFLDLFTEDHLKVNILKIKDLLSSNGKLIVSDFCIHSKGWCPRLLLKLMHFFFRVMTGLESRELLNHDRYVQEAGLKKVTESLWYSGMIYSRQYRY